MVRFLALATTLLATVACSSDEAPADSATGGSGAVASGGASSGGTSSGGTSSGGTSFGGTSSGGSAAGGSGGQLPADAGPDASEGCQYQKVFEQPGTVLTVKDGASWWEHQPLPNEGFYCARYEFDMATVDNLADIKAKGGCPIFTSIAGIGGNGKQLAGGLFKVYRAQAGCPLGPTRLEMDTFVEGVVEPHPYVLGQTYRVVITVEPFTSSVALFQNGAQVGQAVSASITGATVADTVGARFSLGLKKELTNAYYPNYDAVYSNLEIWVSQAP